MRKLFFLLVFLPCLTGTYGQMAKTTGAVVGLTKLDLGLQGIGLSYEPRVSDKLTADFCAGIGGGYDIAESFLDYEVLKPALYLSVTPKYFYNIGKRDARGKNTRFNSGNYVGIRVKYVTPFKRKDDQIRNSVLTNIHWGIQRAIGGQWLLNAHAGVGYAQDIDYNFGTIYPSLDIKFAYVFQRAKKLS